MQKLVDRRVKFEMNPVYPPEDCSDATRFAWMQLTPKDRRKNFILHELEQCRTIPVVSAQRNCSFDVPLLWSFIVVCSVCCALRVCCCVLVNTCCHSVASDGAACVCSCSSAQSN